MNLSNKLRNHFATNPLSCNWFNIIEPRTIANLPAVEIVTSFIPLSDRQAIKAAFKAFGVVTNEADGLQVTFPSASAGKMLYQSGTDIRSIVSSFKILFEKSLRAWDEKEVPMVGHKFHFNVSAYSNYISKFQLGGIEYFVRFTIRKIGKDSSVHASTISEVAIYRKTEGIPADSHLENPEDSHRMPFIDNKITFFSPTVNEAMNVEFHHFSPPRAYHRPNPARNIDPAEFNTMAQSIKPHNHCPKQSLTDCLEMMFQGQKACGAQTRSERRHDDTKKLLELGIPQTPNTTQL